MVLYAGRQKEPLSWWAENYTAVFFVYQKDAPATVFSCIV